VTYLWQHDDWTRRFRWDVARTLPLLTAVRRAQGHLLGRAEGLGIELGSEVHADTLVLDALKTAAVEGERLDPQGVRSSVARHLGIPDAGRVTAARHVDGLVEMLVDATSRAEAPLTAERLHGWHAGLFPTGHSGIHRITVAGWRVGSEPMRVVSGRPGKTTVHFEAPPSDRIPAEMEAFSRWWAAGVEPTDGVLRAAVAHLWFVTVHPYDDGNGRITRAITDMALARDEGTGTRLYSMSAQIEADRADYYAQLQAAQGGDGEITDWMIWFLQTLHAAIEASETRLDHVLARGRFWQEHGGVALNARQTKVVGRMLEAGPGGFEGGLSTRKYASLTKTSRATAQREIADLVAKGVLVRLPGGGRSTSYALAW
jgi:Fic family protein